MARTCLFAPAPTVRRIRAYFAPVNRVERVPTIFDAAVQGGFDLDAPPAPWISLGWIQNLVRKPSSRTSSVLTGIPATAQEQVRETVAAEVSLQFLSWTKLTMALATGSQHMNLLAVQSDASPAATGATARSAVSVQSGSTSTLIELMPSDASKFEAGSIVAVDRDYAGQTGFVGSPVAGAFVRKPYADVDYIRRVTFNVGVVSEVSANALTLARPLPGGAPESSAKVQAVTGFVDREGGSFYQEWSALFVIEGSQGDRVFFHYPRLQNMASAEEIMDPLDENTSGGYTRVTLKGTYLALPVTDPLDGEQVLCYRSFLPTVKPLV